MIRSKEKSVANRYSKIAYVKTGWSEYYRWDVVVGKHRNINRYNEAYEKFNFLPGKDNIYYGYLPPIGKFKVPPKPDTTNGWLLIFVAAREGVGRLTVVGWYEDATFEGRYLKRPEYALGIPFEHDVNGKQFEYCLRTRKAVLIPPDSRRTTIDGDHFRRTPVIYVKGGKKISKWREKLANRAIKIVSAGESRDDTTTDIQGYGYASAERRTKIEEAAIKYVKIKFGRTYEVKDRQSDKCGYDLLLIHKKTKEELHVEVKGTSQEFPRFFITKNEYEYMPHPSWRIAIVSNALKEPRLELLDKCLLERRFRVEPIQWLGVLKD